MEILPVDYTIPGLPGSSRSNLGMPSGEGENIPNTLPKVLETAPLTTTQLPTTSTAMADNLPFVMPGTGTH